MSGHPASTIDSASLEAILTQMADRVVAKTTGVIMPISSPTISLLFDKYVRQRVEIKHKNDNNARAWWSGYGHVFADREVHTLSRTEIQEWHDEIARRSPSAAKRAVDVLSAIINFALGREYMPPIANPCKSIEKITVPSRTRFLHPEEMLRLKNVLDHETPVVRDFVWLALLTGARRGNLLAMEWSEIDLALGLWTILSEKSKNRVEMIIPLAEPAIEILRNRRKWVQDKRWVFPATTESQGRIQV